MKSLFLKSFSNIFYFFPLFLISGPFLPDLFISLSAIFFLLYLLIYKKINILYNKYFLYLLLFYIYILIISFFSDNILHSLQTSLPYIRHILFVFFIIFLINEKYLSMNRFLNVFLIIYTIVLFDGFYQYIFNINLLGFPKSSSGRLSSFLQEEYILGSYLIRLLPILLGLIILQNNIKHNYKNILIYVYILLSGILILLSGERTALFLFCLFCILLLILFKIELKIKIIAFILCFTPIIIITFLNQSVKDRIISQTYQTISSELEISSFVSSQYRYHFKSAIGMFNDNKIFGNGPKIYRIKCKDEKYYENNFSCQTHPHNTYIQLLAETGIIGFSFVFFGFMYISLYLIKDFYFYHFNNTPILSNYNLMFVLTIFINLWPIVPTGNFFNNWISAIYFFPFIFFINYSLQNK